MDYKNFYANCQESRDLVEKVRERKNAATLARRALLEKWEANFLQVTEGIHAGEVIGIGYTESQNNNWLKLKSRTENGFVYLPKKNTNKGRELAADMRNPELTHDDSEFVINELDLWKLESGAQGKGFALFCPVAFVFEDGALVVRLPMGNNKDKMPEIPAWLKECSEDKLKVFENRKLL